MMHIKNIVFILISSMLLVIVLCQCERYWKLYNFNNTRILNNDDTVQVTGGQQCVETCINSTNCTSVGISVTNNVINCYLYHVKIYSGMLGQSTSNMVYYIPMTPIEKITTDYKCFHNESFCYRFHHSIEKTWTESEAICEEEGGSLLIVNSQFKMNLMQQFLLNQYGIVEASNKFVYLGATDIHAEGMWNWFNGEPVNEALFLPNRPDNFANNQHCLCYRIYNSTVRGLDDKDCEVNGLQKQITVVFILIICSVVEALYDPSDFIINVDFVCPKVAGGTMQIKVETDIPDTLPFTYCRDPFTYYYMEPDENEDYVIEVSFSGNDVEGCVLTKTKSGEIYTLEVYVPMAGGIFTSEDLPHLVTCSYEDTTNEQTDSTIFTDSAQPIEESLHTLGKVGQSDVDLYLENILEEKVTSAIALGSSIRIVAELKGNHPDEVSFQAISCKAISNDNHYSILVGGCGDGIIVPRKKGFNTEGKKITSPFFHSFRIRGSNTLSFDCTFAICQNNCDGDSCPNVADRSRREVRYVKVLPNGKTKFLTRDDILVTGDEPNIDNDIIQSKSNINNMEKIRLSTLQITIGKENGRIPESVIRLAKSDAKIGEAETDINFNDEFPIADSLYSDIIFNEPSTVNTEPSLHDASPKSKNPLSPKSKDPVDTSIWFIIGISVGFSVFLAMIMIAITKRVLSLLQSLDTTSTTANQRPPSLTMESVAVVENT